MANKKLKTIRFPGLSDTYTVPQVENGANNNVAVLDGAGNVKDSSIELSKVAKIDEVNELISGKLDANKLPEAIDDALAQAKASGEFNGANGITPTIGANGNWYLGNTDTGKPSRGANGTNGTNGKDGATWYEGLDYPIGAKIDDLWLYTGSAGHPDGFKLGDVSRYNGTGWDVIANIRGATGETGPQGPKGDTGPQGPQGPKGDPTDVQQTTGQSTTAVMSQKATTDAINTLSDRIVWATPEQYGAVGDGVHDDTEAINACLAENHNVFFPDGTYMVTATYAGFAHSTEGGLFPQSDSVITLSNNAKIKCITGTTDFYSIIHIYNVSNVIIQGGKVEGDKETHTPISTETYEFGCGVIVQNSNNIVVRDMEIYNCIGDGITTDYSGNNNVRFENIKIHDCRRQGISIISGNDIVVSNCEIYNINGTMPKCGIDIEPDGTRTVENVLIENCYIHDNTEASLLTANTTNTINGIRVVGCTLDYLHLNGGTNVAVGTSSIKRVTVGCQDVAVLSNCTINKMMLNCGNAVFSNCRFACDNESYFIQVLSDRVATQYSKLIQFNGCSFDVRGCDYFIFFPSTEYTGVDLMEFNNCNAEISHNINVASGYAFSGFSNRMPNKTVIVGSKFIFSSKVYQLFTSGGNANVEIDIIDSTIQNTNAHRTEYFIGGDSAYDVWIENSALENYLNMLGDIVADNTTGSILLLNDDLTQFTNPTYKISDAANISIVNVTKSNTMNISGLTSNVQSQLNGKQDVISDLATIRSNASAGAEKVSCTDETVGSFGYLKLADLPIYDGSVV